MMKLRNSFDRMLRLLDGHRARIKHGGSVYMAEKRVVDAAEQLAEQLAELIGEDDAEDETEASDGGTTEVR